MDNAINTRLNNKKSLGPDKIPNEVFREADQETRHIMCNIFNKIHEAEYIPPAGEKPKSYGYRKAKEKTEHAPI